jgi:tetratricopeptide (TPR) repeat protein
MKKLGLLTTLLIYLSFTCIAQAVSNIHFEKTGKLIDVYYDLLPVDDNVYTVRIFCNNDNWEVWGSPLVKVTGEIGANVKPGYNKKVTWDVLSEQDKLVGDIKFKLEAVAINSTISDQSKNQNDLKSAQYPASQGNELSVNDYYKKGRALFDAKKWSEADLAFLKVNQMAPDFEPAYLFRARVFSNLDPDTKEGLAKPHYEKLLEKAAYDDVKYSKDILEAYYYLGYYYLVNKQYCESLDYWDKMLGIDPSNEMAKNAINAINSRCPSFKSSNYKK